MKLSMNAFYLSFVNGILLLSLSSCAQYSFHKAERFRKEKNYMQAIEQHVAFAKKHPDHRRAAEALYKAAKLQEKTMFQVQEAYQSYQNLVKLFPAGPYTLKSQEALAHILKDHLRKYDLAIIEYEKLLDLAPDYANTFEVKMALVECYSKMNQHRQAHIEYQNLLVDFPDQVNHSQFYFEMAHNAYVGEMHKEAISLYEKVLKLSPSEQRKSEAQFGMAACYEELDDFKRAKQLYKEAKENYPSKKIIDMRIQALDKRKRKKNR